MQEKEAPVSRDLTQSNRNLSGIDTVISCLNSLAKYARLFTICRRAYRNYPYVIRRIGAGKYPIHAVLKNGSHVMLSSISETYLVASVQTNEGIEYDLQKDTVKLTLSYSNVGDRKIILQDAISNGDIVSVFVNDDYHGLPVEGRTVVDIGANIGDTLIYFALRNAKKVIGFEPYLKSYNTARKNIELNGLGERIHLFLAGCSSQVGSIRIDPNYNSDVGSQLREFKHGIEIPVLTLESIVKENEIESGSILKMDCEGCEYDVILSAPTHVLRKFSYIQIEYHHGYRNLKDKLEQCGFDVHINGQIADGLGNACINRLNSLRKALRTGDKIDGTYRISYIGYITAILEHAPE